MWEDISEIEFELERNENIKERKLDLKEQAVIHDEGGGTRAAAAPRWIIYTSRRRKHASEAPLREL